jgi:hypothetical protein
MGCYQRKASRCYPALWAQPSMSSSWLSVCICCSDQGENFKSLTPTVLEEPQASIEFAPAQVNSTRCRLNRVCGNYHLSNSQDYMESGNEVIQLPRPVSET